MYNKMDLDRDITQIWLIYTQSYEYFKCLTQLKDYKKTEFSDTKFISFIRYTSWYVLIIELCKTYHDSNSQHFNIYGLLNKLIDNYKNLDFKSSITLENLKQFEKMFKSSEIISIRERLKTLRNRFYAHFDRDNFENEVNIQLSEIEILLNLLKDFIVDIKFKIFHGEIDFDNDIYVDINKVMTCVDESNKKYHDEILREFYEERKRLELD